MSGTRQTAIDGDGAGSAPSTTGSIIEVLSFINAFNENVQIFNELSTQFEQGMAIAAVSYLESQNAVSLAKESNIAIRAQDQRCNSYRDQ